MHLDFYETIPFARFAASTFDVEREASRSVAADLRLRKFGEQLPNRREQTSVRRRIRARCAADRALIDVDHLVEVLEARNAIVLPRNYASPIKVSRHRAVEDVLDQRRLAAAGDASHGDEQSEGNLDIEIA